MRRARAVFVCAASPGASPKGTPLSYLGRFAAATILALGWPGGAAAAPGAPPVPSVEGFWRGVILYQPAEIELEFSVELARDAAGRLVGTIDLPTQRMEFYPLSAVRQEGASVFLQFRRDSEARGPNAPFDFHGELDAGGQILRGTFVGFYHGDRNRFPFELTRAGAAGMERPEPARPPVHPLAPGGDELAAAFDRDAGRVRLVMLLSPT
ncbi:MAG TPA: hypothetical protein VNJ70_18820 [Thermoanaerobaculia bacterium]|nr:hypothetical protein [Thermoanaerobaculia bacterium]